jgi:signal transduction histidine kinase
LNKREGVVATRSTEAVPVSGRVDRDGRLVAADAALERLQVEAGSALGRALALPQIAALARAAASLGVPLSRAVVAADSRHDLDLFIRAEPAVASGGPEGEILLTIERWVARPMAGPKLALVSSADDADDGHQDEARFEFETDAALNLSHMSPALAAHLGLEASAVLGRPLTSLFRLVEEADGSMPLLGALASRAAISGQRAVPRGGGEEILIDADPSFEEDGRFAGFNARLRGAAGGDSDDSPAAFEESLDEALRSPLSRIIAAADHIVERGDGPLRSDYATYASDIGAAARHLLSVIRAMGQRSAGEADQIEVATLAAEAVGMVDARAAQRDITIAIQPLDGPSFARGEARAVVQILVNILGNAVRHSPAGGRVAVSFERADGECRVAIADAGPGIAAADQQRIFERYERVGTAPDGSGLGLAISRRLARSMGGDIRLESEAGQGARFILVLPAA